MAEGIGPRAPFELAHRQAFVEVRADDLPLVWSEWVRHGCLTQAAGRRCSDADRSALSPHRRCTVRSEMPAHRADLGEREAAEDFQVDEFRKRRVDPCELVECVADRGQFVLVRDVLGDFGADRRGLEPAAALPGLGGSGLRTAASSPRASPRRRDARVRAGPADAARCRARRTTPRRPTDLPDRRLPSARDRRGCHPRAPENRLPHSVSNFSDGVKGNGDGEAV